MRSANIWKIHIIDFALRVQLFLYVYSRIAKLCTPVKYAIFILFDANATRRIKDIHFLREHVSWTEKMGKKRAEPGEKESHGGRGALALSVVLCYDFSKKKKWKKKHLAKICFLIVAVKNHFRARRAGKFSHFSRAIQQTWARGAGTKQGRVTLQKRAKKKSVSRNQGIATEHKPS